MNYIASHVLLVYNEARQRQIIEVYNSVTQELPLEQKRQYSLDYTFPDEKCEKLLRFLQISFLNSVYSCIGMVYLFLFIYICYKLRLFWTFSK